MSHGHSPTVTVVIPTRNRSRSLIRTIDALHKQTIPPASFQVIVVMDGCTDDTEGLLAAYDTNLIVKRLTIAPGPRGPAFARNLGARAATGEVILFLDDDVVPEPQLIQEHLKMHEAGPGVVVLGGYPPIPQPKADGFRVMQQMWWNDKFLAMNQHGHRFLYTDVLTGNLSIHSKDFHELGGFDESLPAAHEDYEFGFRIIKSDMSIVFAKEANAWHHEHEHMTIQQSFRRAQMEGQADILIAFRHPTLIRTLPFAMLQRESELPYRVVRTLAYSHPVLGHLVAHLLMLVLSVLDGFHFRYSFLRLYKAVRYYWYLRGVATQAGSSRVVAQVLRNSESGPVSRGIEVDLDLRLGLSLAEARLDKERPETACVRYGTQFIGHIPFRPDAEPLRGKHLRRILAGALAWPYLMALVMEAANQKKTDSETLSSSLH